MVLAVCVPPRLGYQCERSALLLKDHIVRDAERAVDRRAAEAASAEAARAEASAKLARARRAAEREARDANARTRAAAHARARESE